MSHGLGLAPVAHQFEVRGSDEAGNEESIPAAHSWQVLMPGLTIPGVRIVVDSGLVRRSVFDPATDVEYGGCALGEFTPYRRVRN